MSTQTLAEPSVAQAPTKLPLIDADVHPAGYPMEAAFQAYLPKRWREHLQTIGLRPAVSEFQRILLRPYAERADAWSPDGHVPGTDPDFTRRQLLDAYDISAGMLNDGMALAWSRGVDRCPVEMSIALARAHNDWHHQAWLAGEERWRASINVTYEHAQAAVAEIERCVALSDRFAQVLFETRCESPIGNPRYWPIFEAAEHYGLPIGVHVGANRRMAASGQPAFYFEDHTGYSLRALNMIPSLIFEGVFDRFPKLKIVLIEMGWTWTAPLAWRLDSSWRVMRSEVPDLQRKPSEYLRDHFWFTTQPLEEPERPEWLPSAYRQFERTVGERLMFSSDYPHWDFDSPTEMAELPLPAAAQRKIFGETASELYGIPLKPDSGIELPGA
jgi:uncharacterized protein